MNNVNNEIIKKLSAAAMIEDADGMADSFVKMSANIDRVLRSDFAADSTRRDIPADRPRIIRIGEDGGELREDKAEKHDGRAILSGSERYEEPYITVPRIV